MGTELKSKFIRVTKAAEEYFGGDFDLLTEVAIAHDLMVFIRLSSERVRFAPHGQTARPPEDEVQKLPLKRLTGHFPISWLQRPYVFTTGSATVGHVWIRDQRLSKETFSDRPLNTETDFIAWFDRPEFGNRFALPKEDALLARRHIERAIERHASPLGTAVGRTSGWPWGGYETTLLRHLAAAADRFWKNYDPEEPDTAETKVEVVKWLVARGVTERTAEVIDTILRVENLPKGPRRKK
ncbi:hypothetical protein [Lysobacter sp. GCM10012299]|uniref:hypothetical protein n=1 Tax=Lysobacter sp. GCM10012299 TaxID=3317333 RepID=UPI00361D7B8F